MSYTALYRKYRPDTFDEVKGQDHIVTTLRNQLIAGRTSHAYLFTGSRGTGKTSAAKIFARAVNCENPHNGNPCNECEMCRSILSGASLNVIEIDAASNNGVDNIRQIREEVAYPPAQGSKKVYIIDEVHMLSPGAYNALLKTLEEPPEYVIFILATTEVQKIPVTILSRCQRYDFRRISQEEIALRLRELLDREQVEADDKALRYIARKAEGGMRDALSLTDQCISFYLGERLTYEKVLDVLGAVDTQVLGELFRAIAIGDVAAVFTQVDDMIFKGRDILQLVTDLTEHLRDLLLIRTTDDADRILDMPAEMIAPLEEEAQLCPPQELVRFIRILSDLSGQLRFATAKRTMLEVALIRLCRPAMQTDVASLAARIRSLERIIENGVVPAPGGAQGNPQDPSGAGVRSSLAGSGNTLPGVSADGGVRAGGQPGPKVYHKAVPSDLQRIDEEWSVITEMIDSPTLKGTLKKAERKFDAADPAEDVLYVICRGVLGAGFCKDWNAETLLEDLIGERIGKRIHVRILDEAQENFKEGSVLTDIRKMAQKRVHLPIEIVPDTD